MVIFYSFLESPEGKLSDISWIGGILVFSLSKLPTVIWVCLMYTIIAPDRLVFMSSYHVSCRLCHSWYHTTAMDIHQFGGLLKNMKEGFPIGWGTMTVRHIATDIASNFRWCPWRHHDFVWQFDIYFENMIIMIYNPIIINHYNPSI